MSLLKYIKENQRNVDGTFTIEAQQMRKLREERVMMRRMLWRLMSLFKFKADVYLVKTKDCKPYRAAKEFFNDRRAK